MVYEDIISESSVISCVFLNQSDTSEKTCCATHRICNQIARPLKLDDQVCKKDPPYRIELDMSDHSDDLYCYTAIAGNDTYTVVIGGSFEFIIGSERGNYSTESIIIFTTSITFALISVVILGAVPMIVLIMKRISRRKNYQLLPTDEDPSEDLVQYLTPYDFPRTLTVHKVGNDAYELKEFIIKTLSVEFRRGHTFYEFTNKVENILEGKKVLLQDTKTKEWFQLAPPEEIAAGRLIKWYGERVARSSFGDRYTVFIQSFGSGARYLPRGSSILYNHSKDQVEPGVLPLVPVCSEHFAHNVIESEEGCTVEQFCIQNRLSTAVFNIFLMVEHLPEEMRNQPPRDVILMNRESGKLYTGPFARQMLDPNKGGESQQNEKWKIFVLLEPKKQGLVLKKDSELLYQDPRYIKGKYTAVEVDEGDVRMSKFIETKLNLRFEDRKAFYEATENEEDFLYYKKILRPKKNKLSHKQLELECLVQYFYAKGEALHYMKVFIQSTSQGSRCLKKGEKLLYLEEYMSSNDHKLQVHPDGANHARPGSVLSEDEHHHLEEQK